MAHIFWRHNRDNASIDGDKGGHDDGQPNENRSQTYRYGQTWVTDFQLDAISNLGCNKVKNVSDAHTDNQGNSCNDCKQSKG